MKPIAKGSSDFPQIRRENCIYVDKTAYLHSLITRPGDRCLFLARPRRFGKSLMISTLKAIFQGRRDLFDGLAISESDWNWKTYKVLHFNFGALNVDTFETFRNSFVATVRIVFNNAKLEYDMNLSPEDNFALALELAEDDGLVILIDEYDDPVAHALDDCDKAERIRESLASFYGKMKDRTGKIRFLMITGVSKFTKLSLFSALSNLTDLSFSGDTAGMLGFTEEELDRYFIEHIHEHARVMGLSVEDYRKELKRMFNGYRFSNMSTVTVYNPVSIGINLSEHADYFMPSWSETGKASMLMRYLDRKEFLDVDIEHEINVTSSDFEVMDIRHLFPVALLYQTGYLTIKDFDSKRKLFILGVPDDEVRQDLATVLTGLIANESTGWATELGTNLLKGNWNKVTVGLQSLFAHLPYGPNEAVVPKFSYERCLCTLLASRGFRWRAEDWQSDGRADIVAEHPCGVYIFELKVNESADAALAQALKKKYETPYLASGVPVWIIGLNFDRETRRLLELKAVRC